MTKHSNKGQRVREWERLHADEDGDEQPTTARNAQAQWNDRRKREESGG